MTLSIAVSRVHFPVTTLGPGRRIGIWFQGCSIRCPGCISTDTWNSQRANTPVHRLVEDIVPYAAEADGVTISGGEPFDQPEALGALLRQVRTVLRPDTDVLVYSGYSAAKLGKWMQEFDGLMDAMITGPFDQHESQTRPLMGSDNQQLLVLTELGYQRFASFERLRNEGDDVLDLMMDADGTAWLAGIPRRGDLQRLSSYLQGQGFLSRTSEDLQRHS